MGNKTIKFELVGDMTRNQLIRRAHEVFEGREINSCILYAIEAVERTVYGQVVAFITSPVTRQGIVYRNDRKLKSLDMDVPVYTFIYASVDSIHEYDMGVVAEGEDFARFLQRFEPTKVVT